MTHANSNTSGKNIRIVTGIVFRYLLSCNAKK